MSGTGLDSDSDSDLEAYSNIAGHFYSVVQKVKVLNNTTHKKKRFITESPVKPEKLSNSAETNFLESIEVADDSNASSNLDSSQSNLLEDSPVVIVEDDESSENIFTGRRIRSRKNGTHRTKISSPKKKIIPEADISLLDEDSFVAEEAFEEDPNPQLLVKVHWRSKDLHKVPCRKFQKLEVIYEFFATLEKVPTSRIQLVLNERDLKPDDTPDSLNLTILDILDGGIVSSAVVVSEDKRPEPSIDRDSIALKIIRKEVRETLTIQIKKSDKMRILMIKVKEALNLEDNFKLYFDGDPVDPDDTPDTLDLEGDECFELKT